MVAGSGSPWQTELLNAVPPLVVRPKLRATMVQHLTRRGAADAVALEAVASRASLGRFRLYVVFIEKLADALPTVEVFERMCCAADTAQDTLSEVNVRRDALVAQITDARLQPPEDVPEASESSRRCPKCGSSDLLTTARQTRGGDEAQTIFFICDNKKCGHNFR